jgi:hypothetical protein
MSNPHVSVRTAGLILVLAQSACEGEPAAPATWEPYEGKPVYTDGAPAQAVTQQLVLPINAVTPADACPAEPVHLTGTVRITLHFTTNRGVDPTDGIQISVDNELVSLDGVGLTTGRSYQVRGVLHSAFEAENPTQGFPLAGQYVAESVVTSAGLGPVAIATSRVFTVLNATGQVTVDRTSVEVRCL